jgi:alpha-galactosidase
MNRLILIITLMIFTRAGAADMIDITKAPDSIAATTDDATFDLNQDGATFSNSGITVVTKAGRVTLTADGVAVKKLVLKWAGAFDPDAKFLGDAWERAYGDLEWAAISPNRVMPWYFLASAGDRTDGYGVMTGPAAFCSWKADPTGIQLTIDVRSGGIGVQLGSRTLDACTIVARAGKADESAFAAARELCRLMCPHPRLPKSPVYGFNDWYCTYGKNTESGFVKDAEYITSLCPTLNKPYMVVDDGWQGRRQGEQSGACPWDHTNAKFGSTMEELARQVHEMGARPGLWYRPLEAWPDCPAEWRLASRKNTLDPTVPAVKQQITDDVKRFRGWGFELLKHDFSTNELTGQWGFQMGDQFGHDGWSFADKSHTTAEIIVDFYRTIRDAAGDDMIVDGCNTIGHLSAGIYELQRIGDDTSGTEWDRTRKMGVNCLAFRAPQQGTFFFVDADCAGLARANAVPWEKNSEWLELLGKSGTPLFVSWPHRLVGLEQEEALKSALKAASTEQPVAEPVDWMSTRTPGKWILNGQPAVFDWSDPVKVKK